MPKNPHRRIAWIWTAVAAAGFASIGTSVLLGPGSGSLFPAGLVLGALAAITGLVSARVHRTQAKVMDELLDPGRQLLHWVFPEVPPGDDDRFREVLVGSTGMWFDGQLRTYRGHSCRLEQARIRGGFLDLRFSMAQGKARLTGTCEIPVPAGQEAKARDVAERLTRDYQLRP